MVSNQIISKILNTKDFSIVENNQLSKEYFINYEKEFEFLKNYYDKYKSVPDIETFLDKFEDFTILDVNTDDNFLVDGLRNEYLLEQSIPVLNKVSQLFEDGSSVEAIDYLQSQLKNLEVDHKLGGIDIIANAKNRFDAFKDRVENQSKWFFKTGFPELDSVIHGIQRTEEFIILFARINQGKSWVLEKMASSVWEQGYNVGYISPEMGALNVGYRFDTLYKNFSNNNLMWGNSFEDEKDYEKYLEKLSKSKNKLIVATLKDFNNKITISKLRNWIKQNKLDFLAIDDIKYITDERGSFRDSITTKMTNISEDLMALSVEMNIPIVTVMQANRSGVDSEKGLELETISLSDGPAMNASKVIAIRQKDGILELSIKKQRNGAVGATLKYLWNINTGEFLWVPGSNDTVNDEIKQETIEDNKNIYSGDIEEVF